MTAHVPTSLLTEQSERLGRFGVMQCVDIHCHCLPGLDDGPKTPEAAVELCQALVRDGVTHVIATPHQLGRYENRNSPAEVRSAVHALQALLADRHVPLNVSPGGDVRVDHRVAALLESDGICSLGDTGRHLLLELPHETYIELKNLARDFCARGRTIIVSHPERHGVLSRKMDAVVPWLANGAVLQVTAGSLIGDFGPPAKAAAWHWLEQGLVHLVASDAHNAVSRPPRMTEAITQITARLGAPVARRVCLENPLRVLRGEALA